MALLLTGCALNRPYMREEITSGTNTTVRITKATTIGLWPGTASVEKQRTSLGKTMVIGQSEVEAAGGSTNMVEGLRELRQILQMMR